MSNFANGNKSFNPRGVIGGVLGWLDETDFEKGVEPVSKAASGFWEALTDLGEQVNGKKEALKSNGSIEFNKKLEEDKKKKEAADWKRIYFQAMKDDAQRAQRAKDKLILEEEIDDIATNLPTEQKNRLLHYQASYKDRSIYQRAELRKKLIEEAKKAEKQEKQTSVPSPAKQANAMDTAFEGGSGKSGTGSANFSSTGGGAG